MTTSYRGSRYEVGRGQHFYGIWPVGEPRSQPLEWWPETPEGWSSAWSRFRSVEAGSAIIPVTRPPAVARGANTGAVTAAALLAAGVACGIAGLFPGYAGGASLARQPAELVPHVIYLAAWGASAVLILLGGRRLRLGALLGTGTSIVTLGFFFADAGTVLAGGGHLIGAGLVLGLAGWLACAAGSTIAVRLGPAPAPGGPAWLRGRQPGRVVTVALATLSALGVAAAFAPSWDSYTVQTQSGTVQSMTAGNAFANPAPVIAGNVAVMVTLVAVAVAAALWRPARQGAALLAGAVIPMAAQVVSALVQLGEGTSPAQLGISPAQAAQAGLTISSGLTPAFWIYCAFVVALAGTCVWMLIQPRPAALDAVPSAASTLA